MPLALMIIQLVMPFVLSLLDWVGKSVIAWIESHSKKAVQNAVQVFGDSLGSPPAELLTGDQAVTVAESAFSQVRFELGTKGYRVVARALNKTDMQIDELIHDAVSRQIFKLGKRS